MLRCKWTHTTITASDQLCNLSGLYMNQITEGLVIAAAFDTETTGLHHIYDKPFLFQFGWCNKNLEGYTYAIDLEAYPELARRAITMWNVLASQAPIYLGHNVKFDLHMLINIGIPYWYENISDTMVWIRLGSDAIPERKGGSPLGLKAFAKKYITYDARTMDSKLQLERTQISSALNAALKRRLGWTKKKIDEFFKDKLNTKEDLPEDKRNAYNDWYTLDLPLWLQGKITGAVSSDDIPYNKLNRENVIYYGHLDIVWTLETYLVMQPIVETRGNLGAVKREEENIYPLVRMERVGFKINYEYLVKWYQIAKNFVGRKIVFEAYTKSLPLFDKLYREYGKENVNIKVLSSIWDDTKPEMIKMTKELDLKVYTAIEGEKMDEFLKKYTTFDKCDCENCGKCKKCYCDNIDLVVEVH